MLNTARVRFVTASQPTTNVVTSAEAGTANSAR